MKSHESKVCPDLTKGLGPQGPLGSSFIPANYLQVLLTSVLPWPSIKGSKIQALPDSVDFPSHPKGMAQVFCTRDKYIFNELKICSGLISFLFRNMFP